ncbi:MAG: ATP-binding protein [Acidimicrobiales bacterium]
MRRDRLLDHHRGRGPHGDAPGAAVVTAIRARQRTSKARGGVSSPPEYSALEAPPALADAATRTDASSSARVVRWRSLTIDARCTGCGACLVTCPSRALVAAPGRPRLVDHLCTGCLECLEICPAGAIGRASP